MRELAVRIKFNKHCLGNVRDKVKSDRFTFAYGPDGKVMFLASWHQQNMKLAASVLGRHQSEVNKILWDVEIDSSFTHERWFRRYVPASGVRPRFAVHEAFFPGHVIGINCVVPAGISDDDLIALMNLAGRYKGLSPWSPGGYGRFQIESIASRRGPAVLEVTKEILMPNAQKAEAS